MIRYILLITIFFSHNLFAQKIENKPNFLFILVDDQPYDAVGFSKRYPFLKTPNIDQLAKKGVNVKNFFVTQSVCSPSRASFLTGTYPHTYMVLIKITNMLIPIGNPLLLIQHICKILDMKLLI